MNDSTDDQFLNVGEFAMNHNRLRTGWLVLLAAMLLLAAPTLGGCDALSPAPGDPVSNAITIDALPDEMGRGFPAARPASNADTVAVGEPAPAFDMLLDDGRSVSLASLQGRPVVLNFWATWCGPCRLEIPEIVDAANRHDDLVMLAVNVGEDRERILPFAEEFNMSMPIVRDAGDLSAHYGARGLPATIFINRDGTVESLWMGLIDGPTLDQFVQEILAS